MGALVTGAWMDSPARREGARRPRVLAPRSRPHLCPVPAELSPTVPPHPGVAEQFAITEATLSAWSSLDNEELHPENGPQDIIQLQGMAMQGGAGGAGRGAGLVEQSRA